MYIPDRWIVIKLTDKETGNSHNRVFAGWYGGYGGSDSWQMNSGIASVEVTEDYFDFAGESGSLYRCYKSQYGMSGYMASVLCSFQDAQKDSSVTIEEVEDYAS
jgi:hypothetical protein